MTRLRAAGTTDAGQVRAQNQDAFYVSDELVLVADGMGGYAGGEVAAAIAAEAVEAHFAAHDAPHVLEAAVHDANRRIYDRGGEPGLEGMGTTLVAVAVVDGGQGDVDERLLLANVGDSRCYLLRAGRLRQLTEDHSVAAELVRMGRLDELDEPEHPGRHVLTKVLGVDLAVEPDLIEMVPVDGDRLLLCSDGLSNELADDEIAALLAVGEPTDAARALVAAANAHGGLDNITAVVADVIDARPAEDPLTSSVPAVASVAAPPAPPRPSPARTSRERRRRRRDERRERRATNKWVSFRGAAFVVAVGVVLGGGYYVLRWFATSSSYYVGVDGSGGTSHIVIYEGRIGGFMWWQPTKAVVEPYGLHHVATTSWLSLRAGVVEPTLGDAETFVATIHGEWVAEHRPPPATTTTITTTTYAAAAPRAATTLAPSRGGA